MADRHAEGFSLRVVPGRILRAVDHTVPSHLPSMVVQTLFLVLAATQPEKLTVTVPVVVHDQLDR